MSFLAWLFASDEIHDLQEQVRKLTYERDQYKRMAAAAQRGYECERMLRKNEELRKRVTPAGEPTPTWQQPHRAQNSVVDSTPSTSYSSYDSSSSSCSSSSSVSCD